MPGSEEDPKNVGVRAFREDLSRYIAQAQDGEEITIMVHGKPVASLTAAGLAKAEKPKKPRFGALKGKIWMADDWDVLPDDVIAAFERGL